MPLGSLRARLSFRRPRGTQDGGQQDARAHPAGAGADALAHVACYGGSTVVTDEPGRPSSPWAIERAVRRLRKAHVKPLSTGHPEVCSGCLVPGLPEGVRNHDLRHHLASLLIASGFDVKVVQTRLRHASATTTLNTYGHMWPDADESSRAAVALVLAAREDNPRTEGVIT